MKKNMTSWYGPGIEPNHILISIPSILPSNVPPELPKISPYSILPKETAHYPRSFNEETLSEN